MKTQIIDITKDIFKLKKSIIDNYDLFDDDLYKKLEYKLIKTHPKYDKVKYDKYLWNGSNEEYANKLEAWASVKIIKLLKAG